MMTSRRDLREQEAKHDVRCAGDAGYLESSEDAGVPADRPQGSSAPPVERDRAGPRAGQGAARRPAVRSGAARRADGDGLMDQTRVNDAGKGVAAAVKRMVGHPQQKSLTTPTSRRLQPGSEQTLAGELLATVEERLGAA